MPPTETAGQVNGAAAPVIPDDLADDLETVVGWFQSHPELPVRTSLYELGGAGGPAQMHTFETLDDVNVDSVRELFGGGRYQARFRQRDGKILRSVSFRVSGPKLPREGETPPAAPVADARLDRLERLVEKLIERGVESKSGAAPDIVALATAISTMQAPILAALAESRAPKGTDLTGLLEVVTRVVELSREGSGGGYEGVINGFGRPLLELINRGMNGGGGPALSPAGELAPAAPAPAASSAPPPGWFTILQPALGQLLQLAALHGDVDFWAAKIVDEAEDAQLAWVAAELERRAAFEAEFYQWVPQAAPHREWFSRFWDAIGEQMAELEEEAGEA